jgi:hypothetical protein
MWWVRRLTAPLWTNGDTILLASIGI